MTIKTITHYLLPTMLAFALTAGSTTEAVAKSRRGTSRGKAKTTAVKKSRRRAGSARSYSKERRTRTRYSSYPRRSRRQAEMTIALPFSVSDKIYLTGTSNGGGYVAFELLGNEAKSVEKFSTGTGHAASASFMSGGEVFSVSNTTSGGSSKAYILWKGKTINDLTGSDARNRANGIWVWNDEMYVAGASGDRATLWTNGKATLLDEGEQSAALDVCYANKQTYCCGYAVDANGTKQARIWSSGGKVQIPAPMGTINAIFVDGSDVWVAGADRTGKAVAYKNAERLPLSNDNGAVANSMTVAGNNVYVAGTMTDDSGPKPILWINGEPQSVEVLNMHDVKLMRKN